MVLLVWWTVLYCLPLIGVTIAPGGTGFALGLLYGVSVLGSFLIKKVAAGVPALLGMLLAGLMLRNGHVAVFDEPYLTGQDPLLGHTFEWWSLTLRSWALSIIMLRAGLGLDLDKLKTMGAVTARLACGPCLAEAATVALLAGPLLGLPPAWGGLLGFVIAAVSPAVVVPGMLDMQTRRLGTKKGVPSMVIAAASFDDVLAIAGFGICLALALPDDAVQHGDGAQSVAITLLKARDASPAASLALSPLRTPLSRHTPQGIAIFGPKLLSHDTIEDTQRPSELDLVAAATTPIKSPPPSPPADEV
ncbi:hypothetical protein EMIHUDRAFT_100529 [Emiliania huxleyi CCMP1516]|uniref:Cation/H+ exchanger transmembrane domain-containing protein n=2 Tax=Emiliania huxleyi TaxID=2903 RepID=A0A0D3JSJ3_EMIH1|nr:hypothetical protein EMIHUDRAFT_100529 [Emiliania huxleyi CCMP1516]EOD26478.1 hypothetical protein EMIHUDRAFT_100529 [Emiliania huxleyi CCMP1516]|eukprot:XP_005778907.1 hypothetical protein EMIHUDRAFT_100529 [Emiliania huxleyi CCMP1516]